MYICVYACMLLSGLLVSRVYMYIGVLSTIYIHAVCLQTHAYTHIYICIHTHTHTQTHTYRQRDKGHHDEQGGCCSGTFDTCILLLHTYTGDVIKGIMMSKGEEDDSDRAIRKRAALIFQQSGSQNSFDIQHRQLAGVSSSFIHYTCILLLHTL